MANEYEIFEFLESDADEVNTNDLARKQRRMRLRTKCDPFNLGEVEFLKRYRLTKKLAHNLCDELRPLMKSPKRHTDLSVETKILIALSFYATGFYQRPTGNNEGHFVAQQTVSSIISQVTKCLNTQQIQEKYIHFPTTDDERNVNERKFYNKFNIPGVLGCIGCTHVAIIRPRAHAESYYYHKHYHSLNIQLVCDADMQITSVDASHGGAHNDSFIWTRHTLRNHLENLNNTKNGWWFLGGSGYPITKILMTPILQPTPDSPEAHYNNLQVRARNIHHRTIEVLKARFRCLLNHRMLHYSPDMAGSIVIACVILHNMCNKDNIPVPELSSEDIKQEAEFQQHPGNIEQSLTSNTALREGIATRHSLVQRLWEGRNSRP